MKIESLDAQSKKVNAEYQRHLKREIAIIMAYGDSPNNDVLDSFKKVDSFYVNKLNKIYDQIDSIANDPTPTKP